MSAAEQLTKPEVREDMPVTLKVGANGIKAEFQGKNGNKIFKNIGLASLSKVLNSGDEFDTKFLPMYGNNYIGTKRYIRSGEKDILFLEASPSVRTTICNGTTYENVPFPGLIMGVVCYSNKFGEINNYYTKIWATQGPLMKDTDVLYRYPYGNVYSCGNICWGSVRQGAIRSLTHAGSLLETFLSGSQNSDLAIPTGGGLGRFIEDNQGSSEFNYGRLVPANLNVRDAVSLLKNLK